MRVRLRDKVKALPMNIAKAINVDFTKVQDTIRTLNIKLK